jgi:hypothetical protein
LRLQWFECLFDGEMPSPAAIVSGFAQYHGDAVMKQIVT